MGDNKVQHELHQPAAVELLISTAQPPLIIEHTTENSRYDGRNSIYNARRPDTETVKISFFTQEVCDSYDELVDDDNSSVGRFPSLASTYQSSSEESSTYSSSSDDDSSMGSLESCHASSSDDDDLSMGSLLLRDYDSSDNESSSDDDESFHGEKDDDDTLLPPLVQVPAASKDSSDVDRDEAHCEVSDVPTGVRVQSALPTAAVLDKIKAEHDQAKAVKSDQVPHHLGMNKSSQGLCLIVCNLCWMAPEDR